MIAPLAGFPASVGGDGAVAAVVRALLTALGCTVLRGPDDGVLRVGASAVSVPAGTDLELWASSGAAQLTGRCDGPPLAPAAPVAAGLAAAAAVLEVLTFEQGHRVAVDGPALLGERAATTGGRRRGDVSVGGGCRLLRSADGWLAVSLPRPTDWDLVPAWLQAPAEWAGVVDAVAAAPTSDLVAGAQRLGLAVAALPVRATLREPWRLIGRPGPRGRRPPLVVDLSALWAGPLCAQLLGQAGADVVKVESTDRPDGARRGQQKFYDLLHAGHRSVALDLRSPGGIAQLRELLGVADVVVEGSRPRALQQLGIYPEQLLARRTGLVWVSVTAHGRVGSDGLRTGFGDDVAAAGGLVAWTHRPLFCADAAADPATGLHAAVAVTACLLAGGSWLVDVPLRDVAAHLAGPDPGRPALAAERGADAWTFSTNSGPMTVSAPRARPTTGTARAMGADTDQVLAEARGR